MFDWTLDRWLGVGGFAIGLIGLLAAFYTYRAGRVESRPVFRLGVHQLIGPSNPTSPFSTADENLRLAYGEKVLREASKTYLALWNKGRRTLDWAESHLPEDPLRLELPQGSVVLGQPQVIAATRSAIHFEARAHPEQPNVVELSFRFLDKNDGAVVEVLCGGPTKGQAVAGSFKSCQPLKGDGSYELLPDLPLREQYLQAVRELPRAFVFVAAGLPVFAGFLELLIRASPVGATTFTLALFVISLGLFYGLAPLLTAIMLFAPRNPFSARVRRLPKALRAIPVPAQERSTASTWWRRLAEDMWLEAWARP